MVKQNGGLIAYAGHEIKTLWHKASAMFARSSAILPERFSQFVPIFPQELVVNMRYTRGEPEKRKGENDFYMDAVSYHGQIYNRMPFLYSGDNALRDAPAGTVHSDSLKICIDEQWASTFPQFKPFMGDALYLYQIGGGAEVIALPQSIYPKASSLLRQVETILGITQSAQAYVDYVRENCKNPSNYDANSMKLQFLTEKYLSPVQISQVDINHAMQEISVVKQWLSQNGSIQYFSEQARQMMYIKQYKPFYRACDFFVHYKISKTSGHLVQLSMSEDVQLDNFFIPYRSACAYIDFDKMTIDIAELCKAFQLPPMRNESTGKIHYPMYARVFGINNQQLSYWLAETRNNPGYGDGKNGKGQYQQLIYIPESAKLYEKNEIYLENTELHCVNTSISDETLQSMQLEANLQECKGQLIDALYRRAALYAQLTENEAGYDYALSILQDDVIRCVEVTKQANNQISNNRNFESGYDRDIAYLHHAWEHRNTWNAITAMTKVPAIEAQRIENGYAMRNILHQHINQHNESLSSTLDVNAKKTPSKTIRRKYLMITPKDVAMMLDHSTLQPFLTEDDIRKGCEIALKHNTASVCARPGDVELVASLLKGSDVKVCTVIGFPHGNHRTSIKVAEANLALADGCHELDMVINVGKLIFGDYDYVANEIKQICELAHDAGAKVKVILETCFLNEEQIRKVSKIAADASADWVKTSTGYGSAGYKAQSLIWMKESVPSTVQLKASGGIRTLDQVLEARAIGATRCGVSATEVIMKEAHKRAKEGTLLPLSDEELKVNIANNGGAEEASY